MALDLYISNDNVLELTGMQNSINAAYLNAATVTVTIVDASGTELTGQTWPTTMSYVASSNGIYRAILEDAISGLTDADSLTAKISADAGTDLVGYWEIPATAKTRTT